MSAKTTVGRSKRADGVDLAIRGGSGLGDVLYLQAVVRHIVKTEGKRLEVCAGAPGRDWAPVFLPLWDHVVVTPHRRDAVDKVAHYALRRRDGETNQFQDVCISAGYRPEDVEYRLDWERRGEDLLAGLQARERRPVVVVQLPRRPMDRKDGLGRELLPDCRYLQSCIDLMRDRAWIVQVGAGHPLYNFEGLHLDLANKTTVSGLLDVASQADAFLGYVSFVIPLAESFDKPAIIVWARAGLKSSVAWVRAIQPKKVIHKRDKIDVLWDSATGEEIKEAVERLWRRMGMVEEIAA